MTKGTQEAQAWESKYAISYSYLHDVLTFTMRAARKDQITEKHVISELNVKNLLACHYLFHYYFCSIYCV